MQPEQVLFAAYRALVARDATKLASLADPESIQALRDHALGPLAHSSLGPTTEQLASSPARIPPEVVRFMVSQVQASQAHFRQQLVQGYGVRDPSDLETLSLPALIAGHWRLLGDLDLSGLTCRPLGHVREGDRAYVIFRVTWPGDYSQRDPEVATLRLVHGDWRLVLPGLGAFVVPGMGSFVIAATPGQGKPSSADG
jgi:hypothetical protein